MTTPDAAVALCHAASTIDDVLAIVDRAMMYAASDDTDARTLRQRLAVLNDVAPVALLGAGDAGHLPRPARALAALIDRAIYDEDDWLWIKRTLRSLGLDPGPLLVEARCALPNRQTRVVAEFLPSPDDYVLVDVAALPFAHNPFKCDYIDVHRALERRCGWIRLMRRGGREPADLAAGRRLNDHLQEGLRPCSKHEALDWQRAMDDAKWIRENTRPWTADNISVRLGITSDEGSTRHQKFVRDLFIDPIRWDSRLPRVSNGQHRICGARLAGIDRVMVAIPAGERGGMDRRHWG